MVNLRVVLHRQTCVFRQGAAGIKRSIAARPLSPQMRTLRPLGIFPIADIGSFANFKNDN